MPAGSEPWSGSGSPKHPIFSPLARRRRRAPSFEFLHDEPVGNFTDPGTPVAVKIGPQHPQRPQAWDELHRECPPPVMGLDEWEDLRVDEGADRLSDQAFLVRVHLIHAIVIKASEWLHDDLTERMEDGLRVQDTTAAQGRQPSVPSLREGGIPCSPVSGIEGRCPPHPLLLV